LAAEATWVPLTEFRDLYPLFQLKDELILKGGRDVIVGVPYKRRREKEANQQKVPAK
jgi:hypothetical protein